MRQMVRDVSERATAFTETGVDRLAAGARCVTAGLGHPVVILLEDQPVEPTRFHELMAQQCQVFLVGTATPMLSSASIGDLLAALGLSATALICRGAGAAAGLRFALECPHALSHLVLIAPRVEVTETFARLERPVLVLEGTRSEIGVESVGQQMAALLPECYDILVYDATEAMDTERPEAVAEVVGDFVARGGGFIVTKPIGPILP